MKAVVLTHPQLLASANDDVCRLGRWTTKISEIGAIQGRFIVQPWFHDKLRDACAVSKKWYVHFLPKVIYALRSLHKDEILTDKGWEIIIGWWLASILDVLVIRHLECEEALLSEPDLQFVSFDGPHPRLKHGADLLGLFYSDELNGWLHNSFLTHKIPFEEPQVAVQEMTFDPIHGRIFDTLYQSCTWGDQILYTGTISRRELPMFFLKSCGRVRRLSFSLPPCEDSEDTQLRQRFLEFLSPKTKLEGLFAALLTTLAPVSYLECFSKMRESTLEFLPKRYTQFFSTVEIVFCERYKFAAAYSKSLYGSILYGMQHGGVYSSVAYVHCQEIEQSLSDHWFSWGARTHPGDLLIRSRHLKSFSNSVSYNSSGDVLTVLGAYPLYTYMINAVPQGSMAFDYFEVVKKFILQVKESGNIQMRVRSQPGPHKWDSDQLAAECFGGKVVKDIDLDIKESVSKARLVIITTNSTSLLEMFAANIPTLVLLPKHLWPVNEKFSNVFKALEDSKVLHGDVESLFAQLNSIYLDTKSWWFDEKVQFARKLFCENFALT